MGEPEVEIAVPGPEDSWWGSVSTFCLTFNAYDRVGTNAKVGGIANAARRSFDEAGTLPDSVDEIRTCLFFEQRRWRHFDDDPCGDPATKAYLQALLAKLAGLTGGFVEGPGDPWP
jgi:hypothetical protein